MRAIILSLILLVILAAGVALSLYSLTTILDLLPYFLLAGIVATLSIGFSKRIQRWFGEKPESDFMISVSESEQVKVADNKFRAAIVGIALGSLIVVIFLWNPTLDLIYALAKPIVVEGDELYNYPTSKEPNEIALDLRFDYSNQTELSFYQGTIKSYEIKSPAISWPSYDDPLIIKNPSNSSIQFDLRGFAYSARSFVRTYENTIGLNLTNGHLSRALPDNYNASEFVFDRKPVNGKYPIKATFSYLQSTDERQVDVSIDRNYKIESGNVTAFYKITVANNENAPVTVRSIWLFEYQQTITDKESLKLSIDGSPQKNASHTLNDIFSYATIEPNKTSEIKIAFNYTRVD